MNNGYIIPSSLLSTSNNKTEKSAKKGYTVYSLSLSPSTDNDDEVNLCPSATEGCAATCIAYSGFSFHARIREARRNKANYYNRNKEAFMMQLYFEIAQIKSKHDAMTDSVELNRKGEVKRYKKFAIRLNTFSDVPFYAFKFKFFGNKNLFELFDDVQFYDYTKVFKYLEMKKRLGLDNWHLTFSRSENNQKEVEKAIELGYNIAVVFRGNELPKTYLGLNVVNGDETDLTFTYPKNSVVGIIQKKVTSRGKGISTKLNQSNKHNFFVEV